MKLTILHARSTTIVDNDSTRISVTDLDSIESSSCLSINMADCMDYVPYDKRTDLLELVVSKLRKGGKLFVSGAELYTIGYNIYHVLEDENRINAALFNGRLSAESMWFLCKKLEPLGIKVENMKIDGFYYSIIGMRI